MRPMDPGEPSSNGRSAVAYRAVRRAAYLSLALAAGCGPAGEGAAPGDSAASAPSSASQRREPEPGRCAAQRPGAVSRAAERGASGPVELVRVGAATLALVADPDQKAIHAFDAASLTQLGVTPVDGAPHHLLALGDGRIAVTLRDSGHVVILELGAEAAAPLEERCRAELAPEPWALAERGGELLVTSGFGAALTILSQRDLAPAREIALAREPRAVLVDEVGARAFVSHAVGGSLSVVDLAEPDGAPTPVDLRAGVRDTQGGDPAPREAAQGYALASAVVPDLAGGERPRLFVPHTSVDPGQSGTGISAGGYGGTIFDRSIAPTVVVVDPAAQKRLGSSVAFARSSPFRQDCLLPRAAVARRTSLFVACLDLDAVLELDATLTDPTIGELRRFRAASGPTGLALLSGSSALFVWSEIDRVLQRLDLDVPDGAPLRAAPWRRSDAPHDDVIARGRRLFHTSRDVRLAAGRACASCHPEGRDDGLIWSSPDGARQTPMLAGRIPGAAPYGWFGEHATAREHVQRTFERLGGTGLPKSDEADLQALLAYVQALPAPPTRKPRDPAAAERGRDVFLAYGCNGCHKDGGTDGKAHDVGTGLPAERRRTFDTPSLVGVRGSAPYFHDGRYATLHDLLAAKDNQMVNGALSTGDHRALVAYLETL